MVLFDLNMIIKKADSYLILILVLSMCSFVSSSDGKYLKCKNIYFPCVCLKMLIRKHIKKKLVLI